MVWEILGFMFNPWSKYKQRQTKYTAYVSPNNFANKCWVRILGRDYVRNKIRIKAGTCWTRRPWQNGLLTNCWTERYRTFRRVQNVVDFFCGLIICHDSWSKVSWHLVQGYTVSLFQTIFTYLHAVCYTVVMQAIPGWRILLQTRNQQQAEPSAGPSAEAVCRRRWKTPATHLCGHFRGGPASVEALFFHWYHFLNIYIYIYIYKCIWI